MKLQLHFHQLHIYSTFFLNVSAHKFMPLHSESKHFSPCLFPFLLLHLSNKPNFEFSSNIQNFWIFFQSSESLNFLLIFRTIIISLSSKSITPIAFASISVQDFLSISTSRSIATFNSLIRIIHSSSMFSLPYHPNATCVLLSRYY